MRLPNRILLRYMSARNTQYLFPSSFTAEGGEESGTFYQIDLSYIYLTGVNGKALLIKTCVCIASHVMIRI